MWKSILKKNFFSYKNHLQSKFQLGSWDYLPSQLARKYTFLYISALNEIYQRQGKTIVNWFANEKRRTTITHNVDSQDTVPSIPVDAHPINFILDDSFYIMRNPNFTPTNNKPSSLIDFIQSKPVWERTFIDHSQDNTNVESLLQCLTNRSDLLIASDGSKIRTKSGGGWVIATKNWKILVRASNPDFGQIETMNSYRSEVYASLVSQLFLKTYAEYFQVPIEIKITSCCDNKAYVERLTNCISDPHLTRGLFKKTEQKAYRIIFQIQTPQFQILHVRGHQDDDKKNWGGRNTSTVEYRSRYRSHNKSNNSNQYSLIIRSICYLN